MIALRLLHLVVFSAVVLFAPAATAQPSSSDRGERVYELVSPSVFLLKVFTPSGEQNGTASGFIVGPSEILTNAHVATAGAISVSLGAFDIPCEVERVDTTNDLALCKFAAKSAAPPVSFAEEEPKSGASIYAVGSPRGLERTISEGLFTGYREIDGQRMAQISAPISPGSSGGPIVNTEGRLVGVAVASRGDGQNLNFAVPLSIVRAFIRNESAPASVTALLDLAKSVIAKNDLLPYDAADSSEYQRNELQITTVLTKVIDGTEDPVVLDQAYSLATSFRPELQIRAARRLIRFSKGSDAAAHSRLANALYQFTNDVASPEIIEAEKEALRAIELGHNGQDDFELLGHIQSQMQRYAQAYLSYQRAIAPPLAPTSSIMFRLFVTADRLNRPADAESWFAKARAIGGLTAYHLSEYGAFLDRQSKSAEAGAMYLAAAALAPKSYSYSCEAGRLYWLAGSLDEGLAANRECIARAASASGSGTFVQLAHRLVADSLNDRNVFDQAEVHAKQAIQMDSTDSWAHYNLARSLSGQRRPSEAVAAARTAIRLSDGKYSAMHFALGGAHFDLREFAESAQAYQKAAELSENDSAAAYNVAVSYYNSKYYSDALRWYRESLRRNPNSSNKEEIQRMIAQLTKM